MPAAPFRLSLKSIAWHSIFDSSFVAKNKMTQPFLLVRLDVISVSIEISIQTIFFRSKKADKFSIFFLFSFRRWVDESHSALFNWPKFILYGKELVNFILNHKNVRQFIDASKAFSSMNVSLYAESREKQRQKKCYVLDVMIDAQMHFELIERARFVQLLHNSQITKRPTLFGSLNSYSYRSKVSPLFHYIRFKNWGIGQHINNKTKRIDRRKALDADSDRQSTTTFWRAHNYSSTENLQLQLWRYKTRK